MFKENFIGITWQGRGKSWVGKFSSHRIDPAKCCRKIFESAVKIGSDATIEAISQSNSLEEFLGSSVDIKGPAEPFKNPMGLFLNEGWVIVIDQDCVELWEKIPLGEEGFDWTFRASLRFNEEPNFLGIEEAQVNAGDPYSLKKYPTDNSYRTVFEFRSEAKN